MRNNATQRNISASEAPGFTPGEQPGPYTKDEARKALRLGDRPFMHLYRKGVVRYIGQGKTTPARLPRESRWPRAAIDRLAQEGC